jgi:hypothetical protein
MKTPNGAAQSGIIIGAALGAASMAIRVILGNPPYNVHQVNENDNNRNRTYEEVDRRVRETYTKDSRASNKNSLSDVYVKALRWASDRIMQNGEGVVAFVGLAIVWQIASYFFPDYLFPPIPATRWRPFAKSWKRPNHSAFGSVCC